MSIGQAIQGKRREGELMGLMEWISVKDRLPGYKTAVLVWQEKNSHSIAWRHSTDEAGENWVSEESDFEAFGDVTHWMPLPAPPKGG